MARKWDNSPEEIARLEKIRELLQLENAGGSQRSVPSTTAWSLTIKNNTRMTSAITQHARRER